jgi:hypothetical protein
MGNTNGILLAAATRNTRVRGNTVLGNPAIQAGNTRPDATAVDILNLSPAGQATFEDNTCVTAVNAPCPVSARPRREP